MSNISKLVIVSVSAIAFVALGYAALVFGLVLSDKSYMMTLDALGPQGAVRDRWMLLIVTILLMLGSLSLGVWAVIHKEKQHA